MASVFLSVSGTTLLLTEARVYSRSQPTHLTSPTHWGLVTACSLVSLPAVPRPPSDSSKHVALLSLPYRTNHTSLPGQGHFLPFSHTRPWLYHSESVIVLHVQAFVCVLCSTNVFLLLLLSAHLHTDFKAKPVPSPLH
jgi:hypothetical protein